MNKISKTIEFFERLSPGKSLSRRKRMGKKASKNNDDFGVYKANHNFIANAETNCLFLIDPQNDFIIDGGSLQVAGAIEDSKRTASFIMKNLRNFGNIYVSLDTHMQFHIAHKAFWHKLVLPKNKDNQYDWNNAEKKIPDSFEQIPYKAVKGYIVNEDVVVKYVAQNKELQTWALYYTEQLEKGSEHDGVPGTLTLTIWPDHCLIGSKGHNVQEDIFQAIQAWERVNQRSVTYILKGNNSKTEHYSALKAEVQVIDDPRTKFNVNLYNSLIKHSKIYIAGQARSHCVNFTTRHLVQRMKKDKQSVSNVYLVEGSMSDVIGCNAIGEALMADMGKAGVEVFDISEITPVKDGWVNEKEGDILASIDEKFDLSVSTKSSNKKSKSRAKDSKKSADKVEKHAAHVVEAEVQA